MWTYYQTLSFEIGADDRWNEEEMKRDQAREIEEDEWWKKVCYSAQRT